MSHEHEHHDHSHHDHQDVGQEHHDHSHHEHAHHDPAKFKRQFWFSLLLTVPAMVFSSTVQSLLGFHIPAFAFDYLIPAVLASVLFFTGGRVFLKSARQEFASRQLGMMALISLALVVAFGYSLYVTIVRAVGGPMGMDFWWELATLISIMLLGHWIEMSSVMSAQNALGELAKLLPETAEVVDGELTRKVLVSELRAGDEVSIRPGAAIPADGIVISGRSRVNEAMITGESTDVPKTIGDQVIAGTINETSTELGKGSLTVRVMAVGTDTLLSGIMRLVAEAQASKSRVQRLADKAAGWLFYVALGSAAITALVWALVGGQTADFVLERVVTVLIIACPHALGLAIPLVSSITTTKAARAGILVRDRAAFEQARRANVVIFDKTGTLTTGKRGVLNIGLAKGSLLTTKDELLALAAAIENKSEHSIALAIVEEARARSLEIAKATKFEVVTGQGVRALVGGASILVGGPAVLTANQINIDVTDLVKVASANEQGRTVIYVLVDGALAGYIELGDQIRPESKQAVLDLQIQRRRVALVTGDATGVAQAVALELGITEIYAEVLPKGKADLVRQMQADGSIVAMVGDGVNDAPALAQADVGIAIGAGTDVAIESAGLILVKDDPSAVAQAMALSARSQTKMRQNLFWAVGYNALALPLAAGVFMPLGLVLSPALGAVLMSLSTIIVAVNAQLLRRD
jgi:Cu2+-exporting ATPase